MPSQLWPQLKNFPWHFRKDRVTRVWKNCAGFVRVVHTCNPIGGVAIGLREEEVTVHHLLLLSETYWNQSTFIPKAYFGRSNLQDHSKSIQTTSRLNHIHSAWWFEYLDWKWDSDRSSDENPGSVVNRSFLLAETPTASFYPSSSVPSTYALLDLAGLLKFLNFSVYKFWFSDMSTSTQIAKIHKTIYALWRETV